MRLRGKKIYLYKIGNHFHLITKMAAFLGSVYYCHNCNKPYNNKDAHFCDGSIKVINLCENCNVAIETSQEHKCGFEICRNCKKKLKQPHINVTCNLVKQKVVNLRMTNADARTRSLNSKTIAAVIRRSTYFSTMKRNRKLISG